MPGPDLADLIAYAQTRDGKLVLAGDTSQLQAVENGGGMSLLADARLAEPVRFRAAWEQQASVRLRDGDSTVLADYDQHGRILGGDPEQTMDAAAAAYVALAADGTDTLLMAAEHALRRELSRRIRPLLAPQARRTCTWEALTYMAQNFGFLDATEDRLQPGGGHDPLGQVAT